MWPSLGFYQNSASLWCLHINCIEDHICSLKYYIATLKVTIYSYFFSLVLILLLLAIVREIINTCNEATRQIRLETRKTLFILLSESLFSETSFAWGRKYYIFYWVRICELSKAEVEPVANRLLGFSAYPDKRI